MSNIPERHLAFARAVGRLARKHGLQEVSGRFRPGFDDAWRDELYFQWNTGRHGAEAGQVSVSSTLNVRQNVDMDDLEAEKSDA